MRYVVRDPWYFAGWAHGLKVGNPTRKLLLVWLAGASSAAGYGWIDYAAAAEYAECSEQTARHHFAALEGHGLIARRREFRAASRFADGFLLLADAEVGWPGAGPLSAEPAGHVGNGHAVPEGLTARPGSGKRPAVRVEVPSWDELDDRQRRVLVELRRFADAKGASLDEMRALAACRDFPDRDHVGAAEKFAAWFVEGKGATRSRSDGNATWRKWLAAEDAAPRQAVTSETGDLDRFDFGAEDGE
jgi:DNA-binding transcriptional ArsR family regulator